MIDPSGLPEGLGLIDSFVWMMKNNEFAQGMMLAGPTTAAMYLLRNIPLQIYQGIRRMVTYTMTFRSDSQEYYFISKYVAENIISQNLSRKFAYDNEGMWDSETEETVEAVKGITLGYGNHFGIYKGTPCVVNRSLEESNNSSNFKETLTVRFFGRSKAPINALMGQLEDAMKVIKETSNVVVHINSGSSWVKASKTSKRSLDSVFIPEGPQLSEIITRFSDSREEYLRKGLPYHLGILLTGPPGTGKTSLIHALASATGREIAFLNLSAVENDGELQELMSYNMRWDKVLLVLEDIDVSRVSTDRENQSETVSLSSLLNLLDGLITPEGMVTIATTNYPETLDPALVRKGRFDHVVEIGKLKWNDYIKMVRLLRDDYEENKLFWDATYLSYVPTEGAILREELLNKDLDFFKLKFLP